jgi:hypothetical protein
MRMPARRTAVCVWAALVVTGGGLTLWLQDATQEAPVSWQEVEPQRDVAPPGEGPPPRCDESVESSDVVRPEEFGGEEFGAEELRRGDELKEAHLTDVLCVGLE